MSERRDQAHLRDILRAAPLIGEFLKQTTFEDFKARSITEDAAPKMADD